MAFNLSKIEAVKFGDFELEPQMDREQLLRVRSLKIDQDDFSEASEVLSKCFGSENTVRVKEFMEKNMFYMDYIRLQTYLTQGNGGLADLDRRMDKIFDKQIDEYLEKNKND